MEIRNRTILRLILFVLGAALLFPFGSRGTLSAQDAGSHAVLSNYIFPLYREKDQRLQAIIFGKNAVNQGAFIHLTGTTIDMVDDTLGVDTRGTLKSVLEQGIKGVLFNGIGKKK